MKLAFVLFKYFPYGGLQRDMLRIAVACQGLGHEIHVYTLSWQGDIPAGFQVHQLPARGIRNYVRYGQTQDLYSLHEKAARIIHEAVIAGQH